MALLNKIDNLGIIRFTNEMGNQDQGFVYVDANQVAQFQTNSYGPNPEDEHTCTIFTGSLPSSSGSSSVSAIVEIQSTTGGLLISRLSQTEINALVQVVNGFIVYNTNTNQFQFYQNGKWIALPTAGVGNVTGPTISIVNAIPVFADTTGVLLKDSAFTIDNIVKKISTSTANNLPVYSDTSGSIVKDSGVSINKVMKSSGSTSVAGNISTYTDTTGTIVSDSGISISNVVKKLGTSIANNIATYNDTTGSIIKDSGTSLQGGNLTLGGTLNVSGATKLGGAISSSSNLLTITSSINITAISPAFQAQVSGYYINPNAAGQGQLVGGGNYSINTQNYILASNFFAYSSINLKNILAEGKIVEQEATKLFKQIPFKKYEFKDKITNGDKVVYGLIAEEVKKVLPFTVEEKKDFVPNIMTKAVVAEIIQDKIQLSFTKNFDESLKNFFNKDFISKEIRIYVDNKMLELEIDTIDETSVVLKTYEKLSLGDKVFVYGTKESCPTVAKNDIFEMGMVVLQNALKRIETLEAKIGA